MRSRRLRRLGLADVVPGSAVLRLGPFGWELLLDTHRVTNIAAARNGQPLQHERADAAAVVLQQLDGERWIAVLAGRIAGSVLHDGPYWVHDADGLLMDVVQADCSMRCSPAVRCTSRGSGS